MSTTLNHRPLTPYMEHLLTFEGVSSRINPGSGWPQYGKEHSNTPITAEIFSVHELAEPIVTSDNRLVNKRIFNLKALDALAMTYAPNRKLLQDAYALEQAGNLDAARPLYQAFLNKITFSFGRLEGAPGYDCIPGQAVTALVKFVSGTHPMDHPDEHRRGQYWQGLELGTISVPKPLAPLSLSISDLLKIAGKDTPPKAGESNTSAGDILLPPPVLLAYNGVTKTRAEWLAMPGWTNSHVDTLCKPVV